MSGEMTCAQAGRLGGELIRERYGSSHFRRIGALARRDPAQQRIRATAGGLTTRARHGDQHYERIATLGGQATLRRYGRDHYAAMARLGWARRRSEGPAGPSDARRAAG